MDASASAGDTPATNGETVGDFVAAIQSTLDYHQQQLYAKFYQKMDPKLVDLEMKCNNLLNETAIFEGEARRILEQHQELKKTEDELAAFLKQYRCCICLVEFKNVMFQCGHAFCSKCVEKRREGSTCPVCRKLITDELKIRL